MADYVLRYCNIISTIKGAIKYIWLGDTPLNQIPHRCTIVFSLYVHHPRVVVRNIAIVHLYKKNK